MGSSKARQKGELNRLVLRKLRFDSLEDRRLLAGLNVFVFDDSNASQVWDTSKEQSTTNRVVYLDANANGKIDAGEKWAKTDDQGAATFNNLPIGTYFPTLLDGNQSVLQTTQTTSAAFGTTIDSGTPTKLISWTSDHQAWLLRQNQISFYDFDLGAFTNQINVSGNILDAAIVPAKNSAVVLSDLGLAGRQLTLINLVTGSSELIGGSVQGQSVQVLRMNDKFIVVGRNGAAANLYRVDTSLGAPRLASIQNTPVMTNATFRAAENADLVFVQQTRPAGSVFTALSIGRTDATVSQQRFVSDSLTDWAINSNGTMFAVESTAGGVRVFNVSSKMAQIASLNTATGPIAFDSVRNQLLAGSTTSSNVIDAWSTQTWTKAYSIDARVNASSPIAMNGKQITTSNLSTKFAAFSTEGIYIHDITPVRANPIQLSVATDRKRVEIGQRLTGLNQTPQMQKTTIEGPEDTTIPIGFDLLRSLTTDSDQDMISYFLLNAPQNGVIDWSPSSGGVYLPNPNFFGSDSLVVQAFDGRDWANPQTMALTIDPVNDAPTAINVPPINIGEKIIAGQDIGLITVVDPDPGQNYEITVNDPRIFVVGGMLKVASNAKFDFETEPSIVLEITAKDAKIASDVIKKTITINVSDENDPPTDFHLDSNFIGENEPGGTIGTLTVVDRDASDHYSWQISDGRFVVVDNKLKLADGQSLNYEAQKSVDVLLTVTDKGNERLSKTVTINVENRDDPAVAIHLDKTNIMERVRGFRIGTMVVQDEDVDETYSFSFNDSRFEVTDGTLRLKQGKFISFDAEPEVPIQVTAKSIQTGKEIKQSFILSVTPNNAPWHNSSLPVDVDGDGKVTLIDPLKIINELNKHGIRILGDAPENTEGPGGDDWLDVNGDGQLTPLDAIIVINHINKHGIGGGGGTGENGGNSGNGESGGGGEGEGNSSNPPSKIAGNRNYDLSLEAYLAELAREQQNKRRPR